VARWAIRSRDTPPVARLDRACLIAGWIVEIRLDGCFCASKPTSDLRDRQTLLVWVVAGELRRATPFRDTVEHQNPKPVRGAGQPGQALLACGLSVGLLLASDGVVEVGLDRGRRAAQTSGDLRDRKPLGLAKVARQSNRPAAFVHTVISWRRSIGGHVFSTSNVEVVPAADVAGFRTSRDSGCRDRESRREGVFRTARPRHVRGRSVAGREARRPLACRPTRQAQIDELRPAIPRRAPTPLGAGL